MKHLKQLAAGITGAAILLQNAGCIPLLPAAPALTEPAMTASAAPVTVQVNNPATFVYDFHDFQAQYMPNKDRWFTTDGASICSETAAVQVITAEDDSSLKLTLNFEAQTAAVSKDGKETDCSKLFRELLFEPLANLRPEYETGLFFDKASQQYFTRPEPQSFPLTFTCAAQFRNSAPAGLTCSIRFGQYEYGTLGISMQGEMFSDAADGSVQIRTAAGLKGQAVVMSGTCAGDVNYDRKVDVSDAVLTCRIAAEDVNARVRDIGMALADTNCDDHIDGSDITDIIYDIALVPYEDRVPDGTIPVISVEKLGLSAFEAVFGAEAKTQYGDLVSCEEGEQYDKWYFAASRPNEDKADFRSLSFNLTALTLDSRGVLNIEADTGNGYSGFAIIAVTVPHGSLAADTACSFRFHSVRILPPYAPLIRYIPDAVLQENEVRISIEQYAPQHRPEDREALANMLGYADTAEMEQSVRVKRAPCVTKQHCTEGANYDVWDLVCFLDPSTYQPTEARIERLTLYQGKGILECVLGMNDPETPSEDTPVGQEYVWYWFKVTVPHGTVPADTEVAFYPEMRYQTNMMPSARYIQIYSRPIGTDTTGIPCFSYYSSGLRDVGNYAKKEICSELDEPDAWYTYRIYNDAEQMLETERSVWNLYGSEIDPDLLLQSGHYPASDTLAYDLLCLYFKTPADENGGYYSEYGIESAELTDGVLTLKAAEYRPLAQEGIPAHYDRLLIEVPKNALNYVQEIRVEKVPYYDGTEMLSAEEKPNGYAVHGEDGLWHWEQEVRRKDQFLAAVGNGMFRITGSVPEESYTVTSQASFSVVDYVTGELLPDFFLALYSEYREYGPVASRSRQSEVWETTADAPKQMTLTAKRFNYGYHYETPKYTLHIAGVPEDDWDSYHIPVKEQTFSIPDDGSDIEIRLYVMRTDRNPNVQFVFRNWSRNRNTQNFTEDIFTYCMVNVTDSAGITLYHISPRGLLGCYLPDGTYTAKLDIEHDALYTVAFPEILVLKGIYTEEELSRLAEPEGITFTVKDGVPDKPEYCFDMMLKQEFYLQEQ